MADDLNVLEPERSRTVPYAGGEITVTELTIGQLPGFVRAIRPALPLVVGEIDFEDPDSMFRLVEDHGDELQQAIAIAVDRTMEEISKGSVSQFAELLSAVIWVNFDFFVRSLVKAASLDAGAGQTPSPPSSPPVIN